MCHVERGGYRSCTDRHLSFFNLRYSCTLLDRPVMHCRRTARTISITSMRKKCPVHPIHEHHNADDIDDILVQLDPNVGRLITQVPTLPPLTTGMQYSEANMGSDTIERRTTMWLLGLCTLKRLNEWNRQQGGWTTSVIQITGAPRERERQRERERIAVENIFQ